MHNWIEINLAALRYNFFNIKKCINSSIKIIPVVKNNAYGHGLIDVSRVLVNLGVNMLAVSKFHEVESLRREGIDTPVLVLSGLIKEEYTKAFLSNAIPAIFRYDQLEACNEAGKLLNRLLPVHIKFDTGMGRLGFMSWEVKRVIETLSHLSHVTVQGIMTHFADADEKASDYVTEQLSVFNDIIATFRMAGISPIWIHAANSAATFRFPEARLSAIRPGLALYGPMSFAPYLRQVMYFKSRILQIKEIPSGHPIGYGRTFIALRSMKIAVISVGYGDGYFRCLSNNGDVLIRGVRCPIVGRISMSLITVDISQLPEAAPDDEVVLLGSQGNENITADELAMRADTISYEIYCRIGANPVKRIVKDENNNLVM